MARAQEKAFQAGGHTYSAAASVWHSSPPRDAISRTGSSPGVLATESHSFLYPTRLAEEAHWDQNKKFSLFRERRGTQEKSGAITPGLAVSSRVPMSGLCGLSKAPPRSSPPREAMSQSHPHNISLHTVFQTGKSSRHWQGAQGRKKGEREDIVLHSRRSP